MISKDNRTLTLIGMIIGAFTIIECTHLVTQNKQEVERARELRKELEKKKEKLKTKEAEAIEELMQREKNVEMRELCLKEKESSGNMDVILMTETIKMLTEMAASLNGLKADLDQLL